MARLVAHRCIERAGLMLFIFFTTSMMVGCADDTVPPPSDLYALPPQNHPEDYSHSRKEFGEALTKIHKGMSAEEARQILGDPDDIQTRADPGGNWGRIRQTWSYGTDRHLGFATLGVVTIADDGKVDFFSGTNGGNELTTGLDEHELRRLLRLLHEANSMWYVNPRYTIAAVNALQPVGKKLGSAVLDEYLDVEGNPGVPEGIGFFFVAQLLLDRTISTDKTLNDRSIAVEWFDVPYVRTAIVDDIPLVPAFWGLSYSLVELAKHHLGELEEQGGWRNRPLTPTNDLMTAYEKLAAELPKNENIQSYRANVAKQLLRLIDTAYRSPMLDEKNRAASSDKVLASFATDCKNVQSLHIHWDPQLDCYVRADGTTLVPAAPEPYYATHFIQPQFDGKPNDGTEIVITRFNSTWIFLSCAMTRPNMPLPTVRIRLIRPNGLGQIIFDARKKLLDTSGGLDPGTSGSAEHVRLEPGGRVKVEVIRDNDRFVSQPIQP